MFLSKLRRSRNYKLCRISADDILPNPHQPRRNMDEALLAKLADSIRANGLISPLTVRRREDGCFELISGERRLLAARKAGFSKVPCLVLTSDALNSAAFPLLDSLHTSPPDVFEEAAAIRRAMDSFRLSRSAAAAKLGISESGIAARLSVLKLNDAQRSRALEGGLDLNAIKTVASLPVEKRDKALDSLLLRREAPSEEKANDNRRKISGAADTRFFDNSLNRLMESVSAAGLKASLSRRNTSGYSEYIIRISKADSSDRQLTLF